MARIRTIKPSFWKHEDLSALPEATHMLAAALLNYADDYGYFNANPKLIQAECSPLRQPSISVPESLRSLQTAGYLALGEGSDGKQYGRIINFDEHQRVSHPTASKIAAISIKWNNSGEIPETIQNITEPLGPEGNKEEEGNKEGKGTDIAVAPDLVTAMDTWNELAVECDLSRVQVLTEPRKRSLARRLEECGGIEGWRTALGKVRSNPFLRGKNKQGWKASFDFLLQQSSFTKLMEDGYEGTAPSGGGFVHLARERSHESDRYTE